MAELAGRSIVGEYSPGAPTQVEQWDQDKFIELLDAVFASDSRVKSIGWRQYTPYFNDGDACVFGASVDGVAFEPVTGLSRYDGFLADEESVECHSTWTLRPGEGEWRWDDEGGRVYTYADDPKRHVNWPLYKALQEFTSGVERGHFDNLLLENFGDHVEVVALPNEFRVEYYEHD